jgi:hypothetical protein
MNSKIKIRGLLRYFPRVLICSCFSLPVVAEQQLDYIPGATESFAVPLASENILFTTTVPNSVFRTITVPDDTHADIEISARDCCIRDDVVVVFLGGCQVASIDSRGGAWGTHPGETHVLSVGPGTHDVEYRLISDNEGPSGWEISETLKPGTGQHTCQGAPLDEEKVGDLFGNATCAPATVLDEIGDVMDNVGNTLRLFCKNGRFELMFEPAQGGTFGPIGICPWIGGQNGRSRIFSTGNYAPEDGLQDVFVRTRWISREEGDLHDRDGKIDDNEFVFNTINQSGQAYHHEDGCQVNSRSCAPNCEAMYDGDAGYTPCPGGTSSGSGSPLLLAQSQNQPTEEVVMTLEETSPQCDLNFDGLCDHLDTSIFENALGSSRGDPEYNLYADHDGDGIVTEVDASYLGFSGPVDINDLVTVHLSGISHDRRRRISRTLATVENISSEQISTPLYIVVLTISDAFVTVADADGTTADGKPFFNISDQVPGPELDPGETTTRKTLVFNNPLMRRFSIDVEVRAQVVSTE